jgi:hypothetical protein
MISAKTLGLQNPLLPSKPLGDNHRLATVFLPENFGDISSEAVPEEAIESRSKYVPRFTPNDDGVTEEDKGEKYSAVVGENAAEQRRSNLSAKLSQNASPTLVESLSQIRPLNEATMELSRAIAPEIVFDLPGSNNSLVPRPKNASGSLSANSELPNSWSSLADLLENISESNLDNFPQEEIIFTPTGFQRQNSEMKHDSRKTSAAASLPPEDTYVPSVVQPVTLTSPYLASEPELPDNLDAIAREVYRRVVARLQIERERNGRSYSGRLPW